MPRSGKRVYEGKNNNVAPLLSYAGPTVPDLAILYRIATWGKSLRYVLPAHHHSVTGVTKVRWLSLHFKIKFLREVVKMGCLCNINVWRRKSGSSMEGFYSHLSCISRIFRPECSFDRQEAMNPCIQASDFSPPCPGAQGRGNGFCRFVKKLDNQTKTRIPSLAA